MSYAWRALAMADHYHAGQLDKIGEPYIGHPARVAAAVWAETASDEATAVAWLHDTVEDTELTLDAVRLAFPASIAEAVDAITKRKGESFAAYYERVKANDLALVVKWHDVADNADPRRLARVAPDTRERLRAKYERARETLRMEREMKANDVAPEPQLVGTYLEMDDTMLEASAWHGRDSIERAIGQALHGLAREADQQHLSLDWKTLGIKVWHEEEQVTEGGWVKPAGLRFRLRVVGIANAKEVSVEGYARQSNDGPTEWPTEPTITWSTTEVQGS